MHRLPNCLTSMFVRQPSVCEGIKHSSFFFTMLSSTQYSRFIVRITKNRSDSLVFVRIVFVPKSSHNEFVFVYSFIFMYSS